MLGWATGNLPEPQNNPQVGMANMRTHAGAAKGQTVKVGREGIKFASVALPKQQRETKIVKDIAGRDRQGDCRVDQKMKPKE